MRGTSTFSSIVWADATCFNFKHVDPALFAELDALTARSIERLRAEGILD